MAFNLPSIKNKPVPHGSSIQQDRGEFGVPELIKTGLAANNSAEHIHPLISSEKNFYKNRDHLNMVMLRNTQGIHAPLRLQMEFKAAQKVGRLPFLESSNIMLDTLTGRDIELMPEDIYNTAEFRETIGQPHAIMEKSFGIL